MSGCKKQCVFVCGRGGRVSSFASRVVCEEFAQSCLAQREKRMVRLLPTSGYWGSPVEGRTRRDRGATELQRAADHRAGCERGSAGSLGGKHGRGRREGMGGLHREEQQSRYLDPLAANKRGVSTWRVRQAKGWVCERLGVVRGGGRYEAETPRMLRAPHIRRRFAWGLNKRGHVPLCGSSKRARFSLFGSLAFATPTRMLQPFQDARRAV